jgi:O-antigen ligase
MERYNIKRIILKDKVLLLFFLFLLVNFFSYATATTIGTTLIPVRIGFLSILLLILFRKQLGYRTIGNRYLAFLLFFFSLSFIVNFDSSDPFFFFSVFISVIVFSFFIDYLRRYYPLYGDKILLNMIFFALLFFPIVLLLHPLDIRLNLYGDESIARFGLKSRFLGWSCAVIYGILLYFFRQKKAVWWQKIFIVVVFFFIIISGSRSSLLGVFVVSILYFIHLKTKVMYFIAGAVVVLLIASIFQKQIESYSNLVSFKQREEARETGVSQGGYREDVLQDALKMSLEHVGNFMFGFGPGKFKETLSKNIQKYRFNELSSHNTYLEVFITSGLFCFIDFLLLYVVLPLKNFYFKQKEFLYVFIPIILIAATEDNFGLGQFLFVIFTLLALYSFKL